MSCTAGDSDKDATVDTLTDDTDPPGPAGMLDIVSCCGTCLPEIVFIPPQACVSQIYQNGNQLAVDGFGDVPCEQIGGTGSLLCTYKIINPSTSGYTHQYGCDWPSYFACEQLDDADPDGEGLTDEELCQFFERTHLEEAFGLSAVHASFDDAAADACGVAVETALQPGCLAPDPQPHTELQADECHPHLTRTYTETDVEFTFVIDEDESDLEVTYNSTTILSVPLRGALFAGVSPNRLLAGVATADDTAWNGNTWSELGVGFLADIDVDVGNGTLTIQNSELGGIWWSGFNTNANLRQAWDLSPSQGASGTFNLTTLTWSITYSQSTPIGVATLTLAGPLLPQTAP